MGLHKLDSKVQNIAFKLDALLRFIPRFIIGAVFIPAGWGKLNNLNHTIDFFQSVGIPLSSVLAPITALTEVTFGVFVLVGLFTRLSCIPLFMILATALMTAHRNDIKSVQTFIELAPALYAVIIICIFSLGSGALSLDQILFRKK